MVDVAVNFTLENEEPVNAEFQVQPDVTFTADIKTETSTIDHTQLVNRSVPNQHPIESITGLQDILNRLWSYTFEQGIPSDTWVIQHNLGRNPSVTVVDSAGAMQIPDEVNYDTDNQITIKFIGSFAGRAFLN